METNRSVRVAVRHSEFTRALAVAAYYIDAAAHAYTRADADADARAESLRTAAAWLTTASAAARNLADAIDALDADQQRPATVRTATAEA